MSAEANPWVPPRVTPEEGEAVAPPPLTVTPPWQRPQLDAESSGVPQPVRRLGWWKCPARLATQCGWWAVGVHGGAGATRFVAAMNADGYDVPQHWPAQPKETPARPLLLVARTDLHGLQAAQDAIREWWWKLTPPGLDLAGLVLMADAPGRLPASVRNQARALAGTVPTVWQIPWVPEWRENAEPDRPPKELARVREHLVALTQQAGTTDEPPADDATTTNHVNSMPDFTQGRSSA